MDRIRDWRSIGQEMFSYEEFIHICYYPGVPQYDDLPQMRSTPVPSEVIFVEEKKS